MTLALTAMAATVVGAVLLLYSLPVVLPVWATLLPLAAICHSGPGTYRQCLVVASLGSFLALTQAGNWERRLLADDCERVPLALEARITGLPQPVEGFDGLLYRAQVDVEQLTPSRCAGPQKLLLYMDLPASPLAGDRISGDVVLRRPWGMSNPHGASRERHFFVAGIHALGSLRADARITPGSGLTAVDRLTRLRAAISGALREDVGGTAGPLLAALAVGDQRFVDQPAWERLRNYGLSHLMVISGMHISMLAALGWGCGSLLRKLLSLRFEGASTGLLPAALAFGCALGYCALSGFALPAQRALLMLSLVLLPMLWGRRLSTASLISTVVLLLVLSNPRNVLDASFWLSLGAVSLLLIAASARRADGRLLLFFRLQLFMMLAMLPISVFWFDSGSGAGALANLVAIPLLSVAVAPLTVAGAALCLPARPLATLCWQFAEALFKPLWRALEYWENDSVVSTIGANADVSALLPALLAVLLFALPAFPGRGICAACLLTPLLLWHWPSSDAGVSVLFFDVGQGTAVLVEHAGSRLLYDTGGGVGAGHSIAARTILPYLRARGVEQLDYLVISHDDRDHNAGVAPLKEHVAVRRERLPRKSAGAIDSHCRAGLRERLGPDVRLRQLAFAVPGDSDNNSSCVLMISAYGRRFLLPGDIDQRRERALVAYWGPALRADVLLAGHHGSGSSTSALFLRTVDPQWVIISAARANRFGHPAPRVIRAIESRRSQILSTAHRGAIAFTIDPDGGIRCRAARHRLQPFWRRGELSANCDGRWSEIDGYNRPFG